MDYRHYSCSGKEKCRCLLAAVLAACVISWLFYRSAYAMPLAVPVYFLFLKKYKAEHVILRKEKLLMEFKDGMQAVSTAVTAGCSMEKAWREAEGELRELYGKDSMMYQEMSRINASVRMNEPLERGLEAFAQRSGCEDIESFAEIFSYAKRSGGDFCSIIRTTVQKLCGRIEVEREISTVLAGKKLEGKIMCLMPLFILSYLNLTSKEFLDVLYGNAVGVVVMSAGLILYAGAVKLSERLWDIRV